MKEIHEKIQINKEQQNNTVVQIENKEQEIQAREEKRKNVIEEIQGLEDELARLKSQIEYKPSEASESVFISLIRQEKNARETDLCIGKSSGQDIMDFDSTRNFKILTVGCIS